MKLYNFKKFFSGTVPNRNKVGRGLRKSDIFLSLMLFFILFFMSVHSPKPYLIINAQSDIVAYQVFRGKASTIPLKNAMLRLGDVKCGQSLIKSQPVTGLLVPAVHAIVRYRYNNERIAVEVNGGSQSAGVLQRADGTECSLPSLVLFVVRAVESKLQYLPIAGPAEIGQEFGQQDIPSESADRHVYMMAGGRVSVFGRSIIYPKRGALYPVPGGEFPLPAGGRLLSGDPLRVNTVSNSTPWYGLVTVTSNGFSISATTVSKDLRFYRMGSTNDVEHFATNSIANLISDPTIQWIVFFCVLLSAIPTFKHLRFIRKK